MLMNILSLSPWRASGRIGRDMIRRANAASKAGNFRDAAMLYREAMRLMPNRIGLQIQYAHMLKETGDFHGAAIHYQRAAARRPNDADLALQIGHFYKNWGRLTKAEASYRRAVSLNPGWEVAETELAALKDAGWRGIAAVAEPAPLDDNIAALTHASDLLAPELAPKDPRTHYWHHGERVEVNRLGRSERSLWGVLRTVRGIEAIRGYGLSRTPILDVQILINGQVIHRGPPHGGYPVPHESDWPDLRKYVFNIWRDFSGFLPGRYEIEVRLIDTKGKARSRHEIVVVAPPLCEADFPDSDGLIDPTGDEDTSLEEVINARPSMARPARRTMLREPPKTILIQRADQLGDMVCSVPAIRRLRQIFPDAQLIGLLSPANADLGRSLNLFDDIVVVDFPDDAWARRRYMPLDAQAQLRDKLATYHFDMAIDFSESPLSRPLLTLSGAPILAGFRSGEVPDLKVDLEGNSHDRMDGHEMVPHTNKLIGMVEWLNALLGRYSEVVRRKDLSREQLSAWGLSENDRYAVLHDGARLKFSQWPHYLALARLILDRTDLKLVMFTDNPASRAALPSDLAQSDRFRLIEGRMAFDDFDALLSFASVFVGNDSGPKHLASLRGIPVISIHMARNNWNEWGQENEGVIMSRKLPCAGCMVHHDPEECGKDFACIRLITAEEVFAAVQSQI